MRKYNDAMAAKMAAAWMTDFSIVMRKKKAYYVVPFKRAWRLLRRDFKYV